MKSVYAEKKLCCGCSACRAACPRGAIDMKLDSEGFMYPSIDQEKCDGYRNCLAVCPMLWERHLKETASPTFHIVEHSDRETSTPFSPEATFTAISDAILNDGGVVYRADFDEMFRVVHQRITTGEPCGHFHIDNTSHDTYDAVVRDLTEGHTVLFSGTPCQTAGLRGLMKKKVYPSSLYTCDTACSRAPHPQHREGDDCPQKMGNANRAAEILSQAQVKGWPGENTERPARPSCLACPFTGMHRASDVTIVGDTEIKGLSPEQCSIGDITLVMTNSVKGEALWDTVKSGMPFYECISESF